MPVTRIVNGTPYDRTSRLASAEPLIKLSIIKCGKEGCIYKSASEEGRISAYPDVKVVDTTGAGDSFVAGFIHALSKGCNLQDCCKYACAVSSVVVEHMGTQCIGEIKDEAEKRFHNYLG